MSLPISSDFCRLQQYPRKKAILLFSPFLPIYLRLTALSTSAPVAVQVAIVLARL